MIVLSELEQGATYIVSGRELRIGVWDGEKFVGPLIKHGRLISATEHHYMEGLPKGTTTPERKLDIPSLAVPLTNAVLLGLSAADEIVRNQER